MTFFIPEGDILVEQRGALGLVTLNRPGALNALNETMVDGLQGALDAWRRDGSVRHILIRGTGPKAFCAGGDIRHLHDLGKAGRHAEALRFWHREYKLNIEIARYPKPYIALIDGIVMGGGVGVSLHGGYRLAGPNYLFSMPEVAIGFFPDVGATYALPRLQGAFGAYLAVSGARVRRADALALGLATHAIRAGSESEIIAALASGENIDGVAARFSDIPGEAPLMARQAMVDRHFAAPDMPALIASLSNDPDPRAAETLAALDRNSPTSMALAIEQVKRGASLSFEAAMALEYRIVSRIAYEPDFYEGVRARIIDKDNTPRWQPASIADIDMGMIAAHFAPLAAELDLSNLAYGTR